MRRTTLLFAFSFSILNLERIFAAIIPVGQLNQICRASLWNIASTLPENFVFRAIDLRIPEEIRNVALKQSYFIQISALSGIHEETKTHTCDDLRLRSLLKISDVSGPSIKVYQKELPVELVEAVVKVEEELPLDRMAIAFVTVVENGESKFAAVLRLYDGRAGLSDSDFTLPSQRILSVRGLGQPANEAITKLREDGKDLTELGKLWIDPKMPGAVRLNIRLLFATWLDGVLPHTKNSTIIAHVADMKNRRRNMRDFRFYVLAPVIGDEVILQNSGYKLHRALMKLRSP